MNKEAAEKNEVASLLPGVCIEVDSHRYLHYLHNNPLLHCDDGHKDYVFQLREGL